MTDTDTLLSERATTHGDYTEHAGVTQALKRVMKNTPNWDGLPDIMKETLELIAHKLGRVLTGNAFVHDHLDDIMGYSRLVTQRTVDKVGLKPEVAEVAARYGETSADIVSNIRYALRDAEKESGWQRVDATGNAHVFAVVDVDRPNKTANKNKTRKCANADHAARVLVARAAYKAGKRDSALIQHVARHCHVKWGEAAQVCRELNYVTSKRKRGA